MIIILDPPTPTQTPIPTPTSTPIPQPTPTLTPVPTSTPVPTPIAWCPLSEEKSGKVIYSIGSPGSNPTIPEAIINPQGVLQGDTQNLELIVKEKEGNPITSVTGTAILDQGNVPIPFSWTSTSSTNETWTGTWTMPSDYTYCRIFQLYLKATSDEKTYETTLTIRRARGT
jgi:hypothetical protein